MQLHELKTTTKKKSSKRVGRGGKKGTYSGKGMKGQKSRAGRKLEPPIRGLIKRYHKLKGYKFNSIKKELVEVVNLTVLNNKFEQNETVSPESLISKKIIRRQSGRLPIVKILGNGSIHKPLNFKDCLFSKSAKTKIEKSKGDVGRIKKVVPKKRKIVKKKKQAIIEKKVVTEKKSVKKSVKKLDKNK
jgi:large subunit ribosomal protein L15